MRINAEVTRTISQTILLVNCDKAKETRRFHFKWRNALLESPKWQKGKLWSVINVEQKNQKYFQKRQRPTAIRIIIGL